MIYLPTLQPEDVNHLQRAIAQALSSEDEDYRRDAKALLSPKSAGGSAEAAKKENTRQDEWEQKRHRWRRLMMSVVRGWSDRSPETRPSH